MYLYQAEEEKERCVLECLRVAMALLFILVVVAALFLSLSF